MESHFIDAHAHVQFSGFADDREQVIERARKADVWMINVGTQKDTSKAAVELAEKHDGIFAAIGLHPIHTAKSYHDEQELGGGEAAKAFTSRGEDFDMDYYKKLALHQKTVAIGECGLDYFHLNEDEPKEIQMERQREAFVKQIELARDVDKPLMIHCRDAFKDLIEILSSPAYPKIENPGVVHFFTGTTDDAAKLLELGFSFTFGGAITFPSKKKKNVDGTPAGDYDDVVGMIPIDRILSETDAPYVAPAPFRGKKNEPAYVVHTVAKLAQLKGVPPEEMKEQIRKNAKRVFGI
ncbi:MAG TPA: TatD family hydrolase [Candidatus Paceibacterota bacterium]|nr:TatD family hydrolase [Candidatus Paceibacterota bacterium]